jgi:transposase
MSKKRNSKVSSSSMLSLPVVNAHAASADIGSRFHMVSVGQDKGKDVRQFGVTTPDLHELCIFLQSRGIRQVVMESTAYYWIPLFWMLQSYGFEVTVINPSDIKRYNRPKTDVLDACWLQQLHTLGLLKSSFQVDNFGETFRSYVRRRRTILQDRTRQMNRMHKVLVLMNIQIGTQLTDLGGASGMDIIRDIVRGERDAKKLFEHIRKGVKTPEAELIKALQGTWQPQYLFELEQLLQQYDLAGTQLKACDAQIEVLLEQWCKDNNVPPPDPKERPTPNEKKATNGKNLPPLRVTKMLRSITGVDMLAIGGVNGGSFLDIVAETGTDLRQFPSAAHYASWLGLAPKNKISGGKILSSRTPKRPNRAAAAFKHAANAIGNTKNHELKPFFLSILRRKGWNGAVTATARKLAVIYYHMVTKQEDFNYQTSDEQLAQKRANTLRKIQKSIKELQLTPEELGLKAA